ncbi:MAG: DUF302 domain-containing protein [Granulosicoccaceae bacterium]
MKRRFFLLATTVLISPVGAQEESALDSVLLLDKGANRYTVRTELKPVEDVIADVEFAVAQYNYRLTSRNNVGYAIAERQPEAEQRVARIFHFCNIQIAERLLAAGEEYLLHMPCRLVVWQDGTSVWVASRLLPTTGAAERDLINQINTMMRAIADFAVES